MVGKFRVSGMGRSKVLDYGRGLKPHDTSASLRVVLVVSFVSWEGAGSRGRQQVVVRGSG
jgi:hypothetical protein